MLLILLLLLSSQYLYAEPTIEISSPKLHQFGSFEKAKKGFKTRANRNNCRTQGTCLCSSFTVVLLTRYYYNNYIL